MAGNWFQIVHDVSTHEGPGEWNLHFQYGVYHFEDDAPQSGYRFIWTKPNGNLAPERGQARIPSASTMFALIQEACEAGWFVRCEQHANQAAAS